MGQGKEEKNCISDGQDWGGFDTLHLAWELMLMGGRLLLLYGLAYFSGYEGYGPAAMAGMAIMSFLLAIVLLLFALDKHFSEDTNRADDDGWSLSEEVQWRFGSIAIDGGICVMAVFMDLYSSDGDIKPPRWYFGLLLVLIALTMVRDVVMWFRLPENVRKEGLKLDVFTTDRTRRERIVRRAALAGLFIGLVGVLLAAGCGDFLFGWVKGVVILGSIAVVAVSIIVWRMEQDGIFG